MELINQFRNGKQHDIDMSGMMVDENGESINQSPNKNDGDLTCKEMTITTPTITLAKNKRLYIVDTKFQTDQHFLSFEVKSTNPAFADETRKVLYDRQKDNFYQIQQLSQPTSMFPKTPIVRLT